MTTYQILIALICNLKKFFLEKKNHGKYSAFEQNNQSVKVHIFHKEKHLCKNQDSVIKFKFTPS